MTSSRYIIGIDLGTTNIVVSYVDTTADEPRPEQFTIPQVTASGEFDDLVTLPSFVYVPASNEYRPGALDLPWCEGRDFCVGAYARKNAPATPGRTISSAKSWLCAANVDRLSPILPWTSDESSRKMSPLDVCRLYLEHVKDAWNYKIGNGVDEALMENQRIVLTVPASFDAIARELTSKAAEMAGLEVTLLEEPQAAFYAWLQENEDGWRDLVSPGDQVLVCDIGGGTTDFSLIEVFDDNGNLGLTRIAVGRHILLGGDNLDLTLAYNIAHKLRQDRNANLDQYQVASLTHGCREVKEKLLTDPDLPPQKLTILGRGSKIIGGTISTTLNFDDIERVLLDGFFPFCDISDVPTSQRKAGLRVFGLNYEADPAITRHMAAFLSTHCRRDDDDRPVPPKKILFNGGVTKARLLQERIVESIRRWHPHTASEVKPLKEMHPDLAVAAGACWYGYVMTGKGIRIRAGSPQTYYVGVESSMPAVPGFEQPMEALCVVPFGMEEGTESDIPYSGLGLIVGESTEFRFFVSTTRKGDHPGDVVDEIGSHELAELPPLSTRLDIDDDDIPSGTLVPVKLRSALSEIGTMQLWCVETNGRRKWKLEYDLRATTPIDDTGRSEKIQDV